jgi:hypothetical protein
MKSFHISVLFLFAFYVLTINSFLVKFDRRCLHFPIRNKLSTSYKLFSTEADSDPVIYHDNSNDAKYSSPEETNNVDMTTSTNSPEKISNVSNAITFTGSQRPSLKSKVDDFFANLKGLIMGNGWSAKDNFSKEALSKMGLNALLSYGFVSNFSYVTCVLIAWAIHSKTTGLSPIKPGQWKKFLGVYAGFFVLNNTLRPLRYTVSLLLSPIFENFIQVFQKRFNLGRVKATAVIVFLVNFIGTISYLVLGICGVSIATGVPLR